MTVRWRLYVDEAGETGEVGVGAVGMAGILVPEAAFTGPATAAERTKLRGAYPWLTWPLHRATFTRPERHLLGFAASGWSSWAKFKAPSMPSSPNVMMEQAAKNHQIARLIQSLRTKSIQRDPRFGDLDFVREQLPRAWDPWLKNMSDELFRRAADLASHVVDRHPGVHAFVVGEAEIGASASQRSVAYPFAPHATTCSRYMALLEVLLRRVGDFLLSTPGAQDIEVFASAIDVTHGKPLTTGDISAAWQAAFGEPTPTRNDSKLSGMGHRVVPYADPNADPWFVVADFVSSLARYPLRENISLAALGGLALARVGVPLNITTAAAAGPLHGFIQNERPIGSRPAGAHALPTSAQAWALDQARHWKAVPF
jgi:hypothetical protein